jgi:murein DD-endopeptidase MepM/ murein hydrolase activator NlpD
MQKLFIILVLLLSVGILRAQNLITYSYRSVPADDFILNIAETNIGLPNYNKYDSIFINYDSAGDLLSRFTMPGSGKIISRFGWRSGRMHTGTDIKMTKGDTIYASYYGIVSRAKYYYGYGNMVVLGHANNIETYYAHLSSFLVKNGDTIRQGQPIGLAGSTGRATTSHLHFEIRENDKAYDPELVFDFDNFQIKESIANIVLLAELNKDVKKANNVAVNEPGGQHYIVRAGDSLWKIATRYKTSIQTICTLNNLTEQTVLQIGQVIRLF